MKAFEKEKAAVILSKLLSEIKDRSLQNILRRVIFKGDDVRDVIKEERPELN